MSRVERRESANDRSVEAVKSSGRSLQDPEVFLQSDQVIILGWKN